MQTITAWQNISPEVTLKGCKNCCISTAKDETDNNMLWNEREEVGNVSACEEDEDTDCEGEESDIVLQRQIESDMLCALRV